MVRDNRIKEYVFSLGSLTADANGLLDVYTENSINGTIVSVALGSSTFTNTGSILVYLSGTDNSVQKDLIIKMRAGSMLNTLFPFVTQTDNQGILGSYTSMLVTTSPVINGPMRVVGSGLGANTSGLYFNVRYV